MRRLQIDLEEEVNNNEKLNKALIVSKNLVDNITTKYADAIKPVNKSAKTFVDHYKTSKALNPIQRGVFLRTESVGGGANLPPQCIFEKNFGAPP